MRYRIPGALLILIGMAVSSGKARGEEPTAPVAPSAASPAAASPEMSAPAPPAPGTDSAPLSLPPQPRVVDYKKFRDPFKEPLVSETADLRSDLEKFAVTDFKVSGIITGPIRMRAMIIAPDGKTHYVSEKMKIGLRDGVIQRITTKTIIVREKVVNPLGEVEFFETEIGLDQQTASADGKR